MLIVVVGRGDAVGAAAAANATAVTIAIIVCRIFILWWFVDHDGLAPF